jgi:hypothetical protein
MRRALLLLRIACRADIARTALKVSLVVGLALNAINQGGTLLAGGAVDWARGVLNFAVPYCVSSYSAALNSFRDHRRSRR